MITVIAAGNGLISILNTPMIIPTIIGLATNNPLSGSVNLCNTEHLSDCFLQEHELQCLFKNLIMLFSQIGVFICILIDQNLYNIIPFLFGLFRAHNVLSDTPAPHPRSQQTH